MSWEMNGANEIIFSGDAGNAQWQGIFAAANKTSVQAVMLPQNPGDNSLSFVFGSFLFTYEPEEGQ